MKQQSRTVMALACLLVGFLHQGMAGQPAATINLKLDATEASRRFLKATMTMTVRPGELTLYYPKWIPGEHGPTGPITDLAGLKIRAGGKDISWRRDDIDMYAFHCKVPEAASGKDQVVVEVALDFLSPPSSAGFSAGASITPNLAMLNWNHTLLYPKGPAARDIEVNASLRLPADWKHASALHAEPSADGWLRFAPASLETLL